MRRARGLLLGLMLVALASSAGWAQTVTKICLPITSTASGIAVTSCYDISASNPFPVTGSFTPSGTQDVNLTKIGGTGVSLGQKTSAASFPVVLASDQSTLPVSAADYAQGSTTSGQLGPLLQAAVTTAAPTYTNGQTSPITQTTSSGLRTTLISATGTVVSNSQGAADGQGNGTALVVAADEWLWNGASWDKATACANTATVSVTAGNTTQIVALSGTTVIRVCSFTVAISLTGSAQWITGTGTNCGTPTSITAAVPLLTATPWGLSAGGGQTLFRGSAGGELCLAAVTGNVTGFVTYAQY